MSETAQVTVCIPVFNGERTIAKTIESIAGEVDHIQEILVVDNVSSDGTLRVVQEVAQKLGIVDKVRIEGNQQHLHVASNWNRCLELAKTDYVKLVCADDLVYRGAILKQLPRVRDRGNEIVLIASRRDIVSQNGKIIFQNRGGFHRTGVFSGNELIRQTVRSGTNPFGETLAVLFSRNRALEVGGFRKDFPYMTDVDLWTRMIENRKVVLSEDCVGAFRVSTQSWSASIGLRQGWQATRFFRSLRRKFTYISLMDLCEGTMKSYGFSIARGLIYLWLKWIG